MAPKKRSADAPHALARKLGLKPGVFLAVGAPAHSRALLGPLPPGAVLETAPAGAPAARAYRLIHVFVSSPAGHGVALRTLAPARAERRAPAGEGGVLRVSWPCTPRTPLGGLSGETVHERAQAHRLTPVRRMSVDGKWRTLKLRGDDGAPAQRACRRTGIDS
jgi:hypothetical protein